MSSCIVHTHLPMKAGYRMVTLGDKKRYPAHVVAYRLEVGEYRKDFVLHHLCGNKECVNVDHLQPVSRRDHPTMHRGKECALGHDDWYVRPDGRGRQCRTCQRTQKERSPKWMAK